MTSTSAGDDLNATRYVFDNAAERETSARFDALPALFDEATIRHLDRLGVGPGWRCLEVGAGGGSIAAWLADRVGPTGRVLATDVDTRFLESRRRPNLEVMTHDVVAEPLPTAAFDLAHTRLVLGHLPGRHEALRRMIAAVKPGGWLLLEEFDALTVRPDPEVNPAEMGSRLGSGMMRVMTERGVDLRFGRLLPGILSALGLEEVGAEGRLEVRTVDTPWIALHRANFQQLRGPILAAAGLSDEEFDLELARLDDPSFRLLPSPTMWSVWGRVPRERGR